MFSLFACSGGNSGNKDNSSESSSGTDGSESGNNETSNDSSDKQEDSGYMSIIKDKLFKGGFDISYMSENAFIDYGGKTSGIRQWVINEEGSKDQFDATTPVTEENGFYVTVKTAKQSI